MEKMDRYGVVGLQLNIPAAMNRKMLDDNIDNAIDCIRMAMDQQGTYPFPAKLVVLPELSLHGLPYPSVEEFKKHDLPLRIPGPETARFQELCKEYDIIICAGSWLEDDPEFPGQVFNSLIIIDETGVILKYRKVQTWVPGEACSSALVTPDYKPDTYFPVVDTPLGKLGGCICYDMWFPEVARELAFNGCEVLIRVSAYMYPWAGSPQTNAFFVTSQARALENCVYTVNVNHASGYHENNGYMFCGDSCIVDYEGRIMNTAPVQVGDSFVIATVDVGELREARKSTLQHMGLGHLRTEAYDYYNHKYWPNFTHKADELWKYEDCLKLSEEARKNIGWDK